MLIMLNEKCISLFFVFVDGNQICFFLKKVYILVKKILNKLILLSILINEYENNVKKLFNLNKIKCFYYIYKKNIFVNI